MCVLKSFGEFYQTQMFLVRWQLNANRTAYLDTFKKLFNEKLAVNLQSDNIYLGHLQKCEFNILENFSKIDQKMINSSSRSILSSNKFRGKQKNNNKSPSSLVSTLNSVTSTSNFYTCDDKQLLNKCVDRFIDNLERYDLITLNEKFKFILQEYANSRKFLDATNELVDKHLDIICDYRSNSRLAISLVFKTY